MHQGQEMEMMGGGAPPPTDPNAMANPGVPPEGAAGPAAGAPAPAPGNAPA